MAEALDRRALFVDLYELTMAAAYFHRGMFAPATFSLFARDYPSNRGYLVNAGLEEVLGFLEGFRFGAEDLEYLASLELFCREFLDYLGTLRFTGEVLAVPEGRLVFENEPMLEITAPMVEAQLVETFVLNAVNLQTTLASKAARCVHAARGRKLIDFSMRRTQGCDAALKAARASYLAGFSSTSNALAGKTYGIPVAGTMAHSYVTSFPAELGAFRAFAEVFPDRTILLIDTYDTMRGARKAAQVGREMAERGQRLRGVRIDSGDLAFLSREVRAVLDGAGLRHVPIFASGGLDEFQLEEVLASGAPIDGFGIGTRMGVSADAPYSDMAYKLVEYEGQPLLKLSKGKVTLAGRKQVFRETREGKLVGDTIAERGERLPGEPLLELFMAGGERCGPPEPLSALQERFRGEFARLDHGCKALRKPARYPVSLSPALGALQRRTIRRTRVRELADASDGKDPS
jgi:nicotinate phosphoribosyltransferase